MVSIEQLENVKKGVFLHGAWKSEKEVEGVNYTKVSNGRVKFAKYRNLKVVIAKQSEKADNGEVEKPKANNKEWIITDVLFKNTKTGNLLVQLCTTGARARCKYYANGIEITKSEYESVIKPQNNGEVPPVFSVKLENLIEIK